MAGMLMYTYWPMRQVKGFLSLVSINGDATVYANFTTPVVAVSNDKWVAVEEWTEEEGEWSSISLTWIASCSRVTSVATVVDSRTALSRA